MTLKFPKILHDEDRLNYGPEFKRDCIFTHPEAIVSLGKYGALDRGKTYLEPACGIGNLSMVLTQNNFQVDSYDKLDWGYGNVKEIQDHELQSYDVVLTNPPYSIWEEFLRDCLSIARHDVYLLLPLRYLEGQYRSRVLYSTGLTRVLIFSYRVKMYSAMGTQLSGMTAYAWYHWNQDQRLNRRTPTEVHWLYR